MHDLATTRQNLGDNGQDVMSAKYYYNRIEMQEKFVHADLISLPLTVAQV